MCELQEHQRWVYHAVDYARGRSALLCVSRAVHVLRLPCRLV